MVYTQTIKKGVDMELSDIHKAQEDLVEWSHNYFGKFDEWEKSALDEHLSKICPEEED